MRRAFTLAVVAAGLVAGHLLEGGRRRGCGRRRRFRRKQAGAGAAAAGAAGRQGPGAPVPAAAAGAAVPPASWRGRRGRRRWSGRGQRWQRRERRRRRQRGFAPAALAAAPGRTDRACRPTARRRATKPLRIYWIDVEGGGATLLVAPTGESLLFDAGWSGARDTGRIVRVLDAEVGGKKLDTFVASHYHVDHIGGIGDLAGAVSIANFVDHGASVEGGSDSVYRGAIGNGKRTSMMAGPEADAGRGGDHRRHLGPGASMPPPGRPPTPCARGRR